jgi:hypothetical protein
MRLRSMKAAMQRHPELTDRPVSSRDLFLRFQPSPPESLRALLIRMGPFEPVTDAFRFDNENPSFVLSDQQVEQVRQRYRDQIDFVLGADPLQGLRDALKAFRVSGFGLPDFVIKDVIREVEIELITRLTGMIFDNWRPEFGMCGGMAFSAYDFYLLDWTVDERLGTTVPLPALHDYIFSRLLDSLDGNVGEFLVWFTTLHILPDLSYVADAALGAAVGSLGGPIGSILGAYLAAHAHIFHLGGRKALLDSTKDEWPRIKSALDAQAAWPIGLLFGDSSFPWKDHQVLALSYVDNGNGTATLTVWDNRDTPLPCQGRPDLLCPFSRNLNLDFTGAELNVTLDPADPDPGSSDFDIKGIFLEEYLPQQPPDTLRLS